MSSIWPLLCWRNEVMENSTAQVTDMRTGISLAFFLVPEILAFSFIYSLNMFFLGTDQETRTGKALLAHRYRVFEGDNSHCLSLALSSQPSTCPVTSASQHLQLHPLGPVYQQYISGLQNSLHPVSASVLALPQLMLHTSDRR